MKLLIYNLCRCHSQFWQFTITQHSTVVHVHSIFKTFSICTKYSNTGTSWHWNQRQMVEKYVEFNMRTADNLQLQQNVVKCSHSFEDWSCWMVNTKIKVFKFTGDQDIATIAAVSSKYQWSIVTTSFQHFLIWTLLH